MHARYFGNLLISRLFLPILFGTILVGVVPHRADAAVNVRVRQVLPPNAQTCPTLGASDIRPYVYDGALHSFDISITDPSYVAVGATVGDMSLGFRTMTRWRNADGSLRIHVDLETTPLSRAMPIDITLLSAHAGGANTICTGLLSTIVSATASAPARQYPINGISAYPRHTTSQVKPVESRARQGVGTPHRGKYPYPVTRVAASADLASRGNGIPGSGAGSVGSSALRVLPYGIVTSMSALGNTCSVQSGPARLWAVLVVLYAMFALWSVLQWKRETSDSKPVREWLSVVIGGVFLTLLLFWYLSAQCRTGAWAPALSTIVAVAALAMLAQPRNQDEHAPLLLQSAQEG